MSHSQTVLYSCMQDTQGALAKFNALDKFTISSKLVMVSYIHAGVFKPVQGTAPVDQYSFAASFNPTVRLAYWDAKAYAREFIVSDAPAPTTNSKDEVKSKKRKAEAQTPLSVKKPMHSHLQFWKDRQTELHGDEDSSEVKDLPLAAPQAEAEAESEEVDETVMSYANPKRNCCYLCARQFKTAAEVYKHERLSQLHRDNLKNEELKDKAMTKLGKAGIPPRRISSLDNDQAEYRDRARERRTAFHQPNKPPTAKQTPKKASASATIEGQQPANVDKTADLITSKKGATLLGKMGWTAGQGLGATGSGTTTPIATDLYAEGVGLGAAGGKVGDAAEEAAKRTKDGYGAFLERTRDGARGRFEVLREPE
jgi:hypothetical protein